MIRLTSRKLNATIGNAFVAATRSLNLGKVNIALVIEEHHCSFDDLEPDLDDKLRFEALMRNLCGLFVTLVNQRVYLVHQTAKEFLLAKNEVITTKWRHYLIPAESEAMLASICLIFPLQGLMES